jgi:hypothetical protein
MKATDSLRKVYSRRTSCVGVPAGQVPPELTIVQCSSIGGFRSIIMTWNHSADRGESYRLDQTGQTEDYAGVGIGRRSEIIACTGKVERKAADSAITGDEQ